MRFWRQEGLVDGARLAALPVTVVGAGATGSFTTLALAKMGVGQLTVYDDDIVSDHNLPNQFYLEGDVGRPKVEALQGIVSAFTGVEITARCARYDGQPLQGLVLVCVDQMTSREVVWRTARFNPNVLLLVDTRMGAEVAIVHAVRPLDPDAVRSYEGTLHSSDEAFQARCTERAVIYTALGVAALAAGKVKKFVMGEAMRPTVIRDFRLSQII